MLVGSATLPSASCKGHASMLCGLPASAKDLIYLWPISFHLLKYTSLRYALLLYAAAHHCCISM